MHDGHLGRNGRRGAAVRPLSRALVFDPNDFVEVVQLALRHSDAQRRLLPRRVAVFLREHEILDLVLRIARRRERVARRRPPLRGEVRHVVALEHLRLEQRVRLLHHVARA